MPVNLRKFRPHFQGNFEQIEVQAKELFEKTCIALLVVGTRFFL